MRRIRSRLCAEPGCPVVLVDEGARCPEHQRSGWDKWKGANPGRSDGYGALWLRIRDAAVEAAGGRCQVCGAEDQLQVHHRDHRSPLEPGANAASNLMVVC